jgi:hypothetical protein
MRAMIAAFLDRIIGENIAGSGRRGCFIGNLDKVASAIAAFFRVCAMSLSADQPARAGSRSLSISVSTCSGKRSFMHLKCPNGHIRA